MSRSCRRLAIGFVLVLGCAKNKAASDSAAPPSDTAKAEAPNLGDAAGAGPSGAPATPTMDEEDAESASIDDLRAELDGYEARLREHGVRVDRYRSGANRNKHKERPTKRVDTSTPATTPARNKCEDVCDLATAVCGLRERICGLASVHQNEAEYEKACERAERDCGHATEACDDCA